MAIQSSSCELLLLSFGPGSEAGILLTPQGKTGGCQLEPAA